VQGRFIWRSIEGGLRPAADFHISPVTDVDQTFTVNTERPTAGPLW
jgi:hypothetical protein